jgi:hypothetical protein
VGQVYPHPDLLLISLQSSHGPSLMFIGHTDLPGLPRTTPITQHGWIAQDVYPQIGYHPTSLRLRARGQAGH